MGAAAVFFAAAGLRAAAFLVVLRAEVLRAVFRLADVFLAPAFRVARAVFRPAFRAVRAVLRPVFRVARAVLRAPLRVARAVLRAVLRELVFLLVVRFFPLFLVAMACAPILL